MKQLSGIVMLALGLIFSSTALAGGQLMTVTSVHTTEEADAALLNRANRTRPDISEMKEVVKFHPVSTEAITRAVGYLVKYDSAKIEAREAKNPNAKKWPLALSAEYRFTEFLRKIDKLPAELDKTPSELDGAHLFAAAN